MVNPWQLWERVLQVSRLPPSLSKGQRLRSACLTLRRDRFGFRIPAQTDGCTWNL